MSRRGRRLRRCRRQLGAGTWRPTRPRRRCTTQAPCLPSSATGLGRLKEDLSLQTNGLPSWLSPREGHFIALIACHVTVLNRAAPVGPDHWQTATTSPPVKAVGMDVAEVLADGRRLLQCPDGPRACPKAPITSRS